jgi:hypothetical protein
MVRTLTYRDLTPAQRARGARKARESLTGLLSNPLLDEGSRTQLLAHMDRISQWEVGHLPEPPRP